MLIAGSDVYPYFWPCGFKRDWHKASLSVAIIGHVGFRFPWRKRVAENVAVEISGLVMMAEFRGDEDFAFIS
jgi:hypothetical protein